MIIKGVKVQPVAVALKFSSVEHLEAVVNSMAYFLGLPLPPEVRDTGIHQQHTATLDTIMTTYNEVLSSFSRGHEAGPQFGSGGAVTTECPHERLTEEGICRRCGKDCRGIG